MTSLALTREGPQPLGIGRVHPASFRDPSGFVFTYEGVLYRQINESARIDYEQLINSGLYDSVATAGDLVTHQEVSADLSPDGRAARVIRPARVGFVSYPYEWCFGQLKEAALLTLRLQKVAMRHGMSLKDATPYNIVFWNGRALWIDTLSFEPLTPGTPWVAYRQYCEMFLAPLALTSFVDARLQDLLRSNLDGIPLDLASTLLPGRSRLRLGLLMHVHLHAAAQRRARRRGPASTGRRGVLSPTALTGLLDSLQRTVERLEWRTPDTAWGNYYDITNYSQTAFGHKRDLVEAWIARRGPQTVWDLGANDGTFSRLATARGARTIAFDIDPVAVEKNYRRAAKGRDPNMLPLRLDLTNPSAGYGWANAERDALAERGPADLALALALIHHLAIAHNVPLERIAAYLSRLARALIIEFVPKEDSQVQRMLASRVDVFDAYTRNDFERAFAASFEIEEVAPVRDSLRTMYLMVRREACGVPA